MDPCISHQKIAQSSDPQTEALRLMTPERRWQTALALYWTARRLKSSVIQSLHPEWSPEQVESEVRRIFLYARS